jgi:tRNA pseudouridine55 synthase
MDGIVNVYKEKGYTSHDVVAILRGVLKTKKIGHTGTLDPQATGVLPVCLGKATKVAELIMGTEKEYVAELRFGAETDTQDADGTVVRTTEYSFCEDAVRQAVASFRGEYEQLPPMYSAVKIGGIKLYEMARMGMEVERCPRTVTIHAIDLLEVSDRGAKIRVRCSKGTYIRTLCEDLGRRTGYLAHMTNLERTASGPYRVEDSYRIEELKAMMQRGETARFLTGLDQLFAEHPEKKVIPSEDIYLRNGNPLTYAETEIMAPEGTLGLGGLVRMYLSDETFAGLYKVTERSDGTVRLQAYKMFV